MNETAKQYTAFWPVLIVFVCFTITNILSLIGNLETKKNLEVGVAQLAQNYYKAKAKEAALRGLAQDLIGLAPTSLVAQQIVTDFHIQVKNPPRGMNPTPSAVTPTNAATGTTTPNP